MITVTHKGVSQKVPCGKCAFCLTNRRSSWQFRIHHEMRTQEHPGYFITLTYDEKHVRRVDGRLSLRFYDVQLYLKRLRKAKHYVKYICVGEYGSSTYRPHYHMLLWTDAPTDLLSTNWKSSKDDSLLGSVHFGVLNMASAMYTLKYIIQPKPPEYEGVERPRAQFSKALGLSYLTNSVYYYHTWDYDNPEMFSVIDGQKVSLPRYYKNKIFTKFQMRRYAHAAKWDSIRKKRKYMRELIAQGVKGTKNYIKKLRVENAKLLIAKTKFNQTI